MDLQKIIGANAKAIRESKKLTLDAAAQLTGVSRSMLAQIEKGDVNPTISVLWKMANGYKVSFTSLMDAHSSPSLLIRAADVEPLSEDGGRYLNCPAFPFEEERTRSRTFRARRNMSPFSPGRWRSARGRRALPSRKETRCASGRTRSTRTATSGNPRRS